MTEWARADHHNRHWLQKSFPNLRTAEGACSQLWDTLLLRHFEMPSKVISMPGFCKAGLASSSEQDQVSVFGANRAGPLFELLFSASRQRRGIISRTAFGTKCFAASPQNTISGNPDPCRYSPYQQDSEESSNTIHP